MRTIITATAALGLAAALIFTPGCAPRQADDPGVARTTEAEPTLTPDSAAVEAGTLEIVADDMEFHPGVFDVKAGDTVRISLRNASAMPHNIVFELPGGDVRLNEDLAPGETGTLEFTAPSEPDAYVFYCPVGNHREQGMEGRMMVGE
jgi:plastocyanin